MGLDFEYDSAKAASNLRKHGVSFEEAASTFADPLSMTIHDPDHSIGEPRWVLLGMSFGNRLVVVSHTERGDRIRLISARLATPDEQRHYEAQDQMREQYDFSKGVRGKYAERMAKGTNLVLLDPDVARAFPTSEAVNEALRRLKRAADEEEPPKE